MLVGALVGMVLFFQFRMRAAFTAESAGSLSEELIPIIAAFFCAGVLDAEMKRGAHELLLSKRTPLWHTVVLRVFVALGIALAIGFAVLLALHFGIKHLPLGMLMLASVPSAMALAMVSLWTRIRMGNAFIGYTVALAVWLANVFTGDLMGRLLGIPVNPFLTLTSYTDVLHAQAAGSLETTPYVDWWWVPKIALLVVSGCLFFAVTRRVEQLVEGD
jgi:hypothetical protein